MSSINPHNSSERTPHSGEIGLNQAAELLRQVSPGNLVIFAGAGISFAEPACCPTWNRFLERLLDAAETVHAGLSTLSRRLSESIALAKTQIKPELLCQLLHRNLGEGMLGCFDILMLGSPNYEHRIIARLAKQGKVPLVITTNFDTYIEASLTDEGVERQVYINAVPDNLAEGLEEGRHAQKATCIVKPHGSVLDLSSMVLTLRHAGRTLARDTAHFLEQVFTKYTVLVVGYSGNDDDIFPVLLGVAKTARNVFWVLYSDEDNKTRLNISRFAAIGGGRCKLVRACGQSILELLVSDFRSCQEGMGPAREAVESKQCERLERWAARFKLNAWANFLCELTLELAPTAGQADVVAEEANRIVRAENEKWISAKATRNLGLALAMGGEAEKGINTLLQAAQRYKEMARPREYIEVVAAMSEYVPDDWSWEKKGGPGLDPLTLAFTYVGKTYDPYCLGLCNYAFALDLRRSSKIQLAKGRLEVAGGYAQRAGDSTKVLKCLRILADLFQHDGDFANSRDCTKAIEVLEQSLGMSAHADTIEAPHIFDRMKEAASRDLHKLVKGEVVIWLVLTALSSMLARLFSPTRSVWIACCLAAAIGGAAGKVWPVLKARRYVPIDRA